MPQTLLGLLALALAGLLTLNNQQHQMGTYQDRVVEEYRLAGSGQATHIMEIIAARSFDEASTPLAIEGRDGSGGNHIPDSSAFTRQNGFGELAEASDREVNSNPTVLERILAGRGSHTGFSRRYEGYTARCDLLTHSLACDDVDDLAGLRNEQVSVVLSNGGTLDFLVDVDVFYVRQDAPETPVNVLTSHKRVILKITAPRMQGYGTLVQLERVIAYDPIKADRDHENYCGPVDGVQDVTACMNGYAS